MSRTYTITHDADYEPYEDDLVTITYSNRSRYRLGDTPISTDEFEELSKRDDIVALPVYAYVHSGAAISTKPFSCSWDSGRSGWAYMDKEAAIREFGKKILTKAARAKAEAYIEAVVKEFSSVLEGDVWVIKVFENDECVECVGGFVGYDYAVEEAENMVKGDRCPIDWEQV